MCVVSCSIPIVPIIDRSRYNILKYIINIFNVVIFGWFIVGTIIVVRSNIECVRSNGLRAISSIIFLVLSLIKIIRDYIVMAFYFKFTY